MALLAPSCSAFGFGEIDYEAVEVDQKGVAIINANCDQDYGCRVYTHLEKPDHVEWACRTEPLKLRARLGAYGNNRQVLYAWAYLLPSMGEWACPERLEEFVELSDWVVARLSAFNVD